MEVGGSNKRRVTEGDSEEHEEQRSPIDDGAQAKKVWHTPYVVSYEVRTEVRML